MPKYFEFEVSLIDIEPRIWRRFLIPEKVTFQHLHECIQDSLGWEEDHLFEFRDKSGKHTIASIDFENYDENVPTADKLRLSEFFKRAGTKCQYVYDFGDDWRHEVALKRIVELPEKFRRRLLDGARACPPEDCGGVWGYYDCVEAVAATEEQAAKMDDKEHAQYLLDRKEWIGDWKPEEFDLSAVKKSFDC